MLLLTVAYDVWHAVGIDSYRACVDPVPQNVCRAFIFAGLLVHRSKLLLKLLDLTALLLDFGVLFFGYDVEELVHVILSLHVSLNPPPLARGLEDVNATALGRYK